MSLGESLTFRGVPLVQYKNHFNTITAHKILVMKYCFQCGLYKQGLLHDLSKYSPSEFMTGARYYQGDRSPNDAERLKNGASTAWMHHKGRNKHHFEYWTDYKLGAPKGVMGGTPMPLPYVLEMLCDRVAASRIYQGDNYKDDMPLQYYLRGKDHSLIYPATGDLLERLLILIAHHGEQKTFRFIRDYIVFAGPGHDARPWLNYDIDKLRRECIPEDLKF